MEPGGTADVYQQGGSIDSRRLSVVSNARIDNTIPHLPDTLQLIAAGGFALFEQPIQDGADVHKF